MDQPTASNELSITAFHCPKLGNTAEEYEDAWSHSLHKVGTSWRVAIADGATESSFSKIWAKLLVASFTRSKSHGLDFFSDLSAARRLWQTHVSKRQLPWYAQEKVKLGAFAAFLGLEIDSATQKWQAISLGDCCLFQLDRVSPRMRLLKLFPITRSSDFTSSPYLVGSKEQTEDEKTHYKMCEGFLREEDMLLLVSDALAAWLLRRHEEDNPLWSLIYKRLRNDKSFESFIEVARTDGLRNDDFTLVRVVYGTPPADKER